MKTRLILFLAVLLAGLAQAIIGEIIPREESTIHMSAR